MKRVKATNSEHALTGCYRTKPRTRFQKKALIAEWSKMWLKSKTPASAAVRRERERGGVSTDRHGAKNQRGRRTSALMRIPDSSRTLRHFRKDHSITSSARASSIAGISRPSAFAVLRLILSSNLVGR